MRLDCIAPVRPYHPVAGDIGRLIGARGSRAATGTSPPSRDGSS